MGKILIGNVLVGKVLAGNTRWAKYLMGNATGRQSTIDPKNISDFSELWNFAQVHYAKPAWKPCM